MDKVGEESLLLVGYKELWYMGGEAIDLKTISFIV